MKFLASSSAATLLLLASATVVQAASDDYIDAVPPTVYEEETLSPQNMDFDKEVSVCARRRTMLLCLWAVSYTFAPRLFSLTEQHVHCARWMVQRRRDSLL